MGRSTRADFSLKSLLLAGLALTVAGPVGAQDAIQVALDQGAKSKKCEEFSYGVPGGWTVPSGQVNPATSEYVLRISGPLNRIQCRAALLAKAYKAPNRSNLTGMDTAQAVAIEVSPASLRPDLIPSVTNVVIVTKTGVLQPDSLLIRVDSLQNGLGAVFVVNTMTALFTLDRWPAYDVEVRLTTAQKEKRVSLSNGTLKKIR